MSSDKAKAVKKQDADKAIAPSESKKQDSDQAIAPSGSDNNFTAELKSMFNDFYVQIKTDQEANRLQFTELRMAIDALNKQSPQNSPNVMDETQTPIPDRFESNRRSTIFFGGSTSTYNKLASNAQPQIQILQNDIVYKNELTVSSLAGLQYLAKQMQLLASAYPNREIKMSHMVAYNLRPHVVAHWNTFHFDLTKITGFEYEEVMVEDWLSFSNTKVQEILVEAARPRSKDLYTKELIFYLGKDIPQSPGINADNFSKLFYTPMIRSINDLYNIYTLLSEETSNLSNNAAKMPIETYGTKESPGHIQLWLISLGDQKDAMLQYLGKDELVKQKSLESAFKFIRYKLMEGRTQSEARQDFDAKLTPIRWSDLRKTQGESHTRQQVSAYTTSQKQTHDPQRQRFTSRANFSALSLPDHLNNVYDDNPCDDDNPYDDEDNDYVNTTPTPDIKTLIRPSAPPLSSSAPDSLNIMSSNSASQVAIAATFRGYCCELFVLGKCSKPNCTNDHSAAAQERCIMSFSHLARRDLGAHAKLPNWTAPVTPTRSAYQNGYKTPSNNYSNNAGNASWRGPPMPGKHA
jgi:hypothetical protein